MIDKRFTVPLSLACCMLAAMLHFAGPHALAQKEPREIAIVAKRFEFVPDTITLTKGEPVTLVLSTEDVAHSLFVRDLEINELIEPGEVKRVTITPDTEGTFHGSCQKFCGAHHAKMKITIVVQ